MNIIKNFLFLFKKTKETKKILKFLIEKYPTEPYFTTAKVYVDCIDEILNKYDWKVIDKVRELNWYGVETDAQTFLKQAQIVRQYNNFSYEIAKKIVEYFGDKATYRLERKGSVVLYISPNYKYSNYEEALEVEKLAIKIYKEFEKNGIYSRETSQQFQKLFLADKVMPGYVPCEIKLWWD
jgi:hypothetical protein